MAKLSQAQQRVLDLMAEGWKLWQGMDFDARVMMFKPDEKGWQKASIATVHALWKAGYIRVVEERFPTRKYELVKKD